MSLVGSSIDCVHQYVKRKLDDYGPTDDEDFSSDLISARMKKDEPDAVNSSTTPQQQLQQFETGVSDAWSAVHTQAPIHPIITMMERIKGGGILSEYRYLTIVNDAKRWITSPLSIHDVSKPVIAQRKTKSKSGPLEIRRAAYLANYLPPVPMLEGEPGTVEAERSDDDNSSSHVSGWAELVVESSLSNAQDGNAERRLSSVVSEQRDMATQMSRVGSTRSSSFSTKYRSGSVKDDLRDVEMDQGHVMDVDDSAEASQINILKMQREESKINAWENLQKAKAETAI